MKTAIGKTKNKFPRGYHYTIKSDDERKEVDWLIAQGIFSSIEDYEDFMTKVDTGKKKPVN